MCIKSLPASLRSDIGGNKTSTPKCSFPFRYSRLSNPRPLINDVVVFAILTNCGCCSTPREPCILCWCPNLRAKLCECNKDNPYRRFYNGSNSLISVY
ncbi:hypothetical protein L2E82_15342 [Cichorium intybus]|uniref:Uncharacterized protein n=1 Tax=Cichorium intybus TaxID=13427 RepID=A0ACB9F3U1_CICIN|nr:hypothetical protein L2E82_15342 [Cichorium intybus]